MESDLSQLLYKKYFSFTNRTIEVEMKSSMIVRGIIVGFCKGNELNREAYIIRWHIVDEKFENMLGIDAFGFPAGLYINQDEIKRIKFLEDNSVMKF